MDKNLGKVPKHFPEVFPRFFLKENTRLNGTLELFQRGYPFNHLRQRVGVLRVKFIFLILFLYLIDLKPRDNLGKSFPEVGEVPGVAA